MTPADFAKQVAQTEESNITEDREKEPDGAPETGPQNTSQRLKALTSGGTKTGAIASQYCVSLEAV
jgi:hypothetical protein